VGGGAERQRETEREREREREREGGREREQGAENPSIAGSSVSLRPPGRVSHALAIDASR
jgi:hypothetical protein